LATTPDCPSDVVAKTLDALWTGSTLALLLESNNGSKATHAHKKKTPPITATTMITTSGPPLLSLVEEVLTPGLAACTLSTSTLPAKRLPRAAIALLSSAFMAAIGTPVSESIA
jgi:hypothetical protein